MVELAKGGDFMAVAHKSAISVGLLYIPVGLYKSTKEISVSFNQLCKDTHERVKYKKICPSCNKEVTNDECVLSSICPLSLMAYVNQRSKV